MEVGMIFGAIVLGIPMLCLAAICVFGTIKLIKEMMR